MEKDSASEMIMLDVLLHCCKIRTQSLKIHCERIWVCILQRAAWMLLQKPSSLWLKCQTGSCREFCPKETLLK